MKKCLAGLAVIAALGVMTGTAWTQTPQTVTRLRPRPRSVYCHYRSSDGITGWSASDVKKTIQCATKRFGVDTATALYIADRESNFDASATNALSGACGVFQHLPSYWPSRLQTFRAHHPFWTLNDSCFNARANVMVSVDMMRRLGFGAWGG